jgi:class 3 adenylate cyclase
MKILVSSTARFSIVLILSIVASLQQFDALAQTPKPGIDTLPEISSASVETSSIPVATTRREFPGVRLDKLNTAKYIPGDNPAFTETDFDDSNWNQLQKTDANAFELDTIYWCRIKFRTQPDISHQPLVLYLYWQGAMEVYLNGKQVYSFGRIVSSPEGIFIQDATHYPLRKLTLQLSGVPDTNVLAFRFAQHNNFGKLKGSPNMLASSPSIASSLHTLPVSELIDISRMNTALYYGFFFGINCIIVLLTFSQVNRKQKNRSLQLFGLFAFFTGLVALTNFIDLGTFNISTTTVLYFSFYNYFAYSLSSFFLLHVMRYLFDKENRITPWIYAVLLVTMLFAYYLSSLTGKDYSAIALVALVISLIELLRLSYLSVRKNVYGSGIILAGALIFTIAGPILEQLFSALGVTARPFWATLAIRISFYLSMPVSLSIFLARLSVRNNQLLARQRDELDLEVQERTQELRLEKKKSDDLLLNILPEEVAEELKTKGNAEAKQFNEVTVMFTDFKNFTQISEKLSPTELVNEIHTCFKAFDNIITKHNIEKIKTIGDSYMCVGGLPVINATNAVDVVNAAIEIQQFMQQHLNQRKTENKEPFEIRIGVHTGSVVAGIVGVKKFAYDIWGDTVNTASRMESSGEAGKVNISGSTYELVKDKFVCTHRGKISAKGKGEIDMYFVESITPF